MYDIIKTLQMNRMRNPFNHKEEWKGRRDKKVNEQEDM